MLLGVGGVDIYAFMFVSLIGVKSSIKEIKK
jgi:hypothetical protein